MTTCVQIDPAPPAAKLPLRRSVSPPAGARKAKNTPRQQDFDLQEDTQLLVAMMAAGGIALPVRVASGFLKHVGGCARLLTSDARSYLPLARANPDAAIFLRTLAELVRRSLKPIPENRSRIASWDSLVAYLRMEIASLPTERAIVLYLNANNVLVGRREFQGSANNCPLSIREIVKECLTVEATAVIMAHNHPSGCLRPSTADQRFTDELHSALALIDVRLHDSIVVSRQGIVSFAQEGLMPASDPAY